MKIIYNNTIYTKESKSDDLTGLYYLVLWKSYLEEQNTWKLLLAI